MYFFFYVQIRTRTLLIQSKAKLDLKPALQLPLSSSPKNLFQFNLTTKIKNSLKSKTDHPKNIGITQQMLKINVLINQLFKTLIPASIYQIRPIAIQLEISKILERYKFFFQLFDFLESNLPLNSNLSFYRPKNCYNQSHR